MSENFRSLRWKLNPWHSFEVYAWWLSAFVKGITSDNKLMNLCEIGLFHIVWGVSRATRDNYRILLPWPIYMNFGGTLKSFSVHAFTCVYTSSMMQVLGSVIHIMRYMVHLTFFVYYLKKRKKVQEHDLY